MKIPVREQKQPRQYIVKALFELLEHKNYHDITISRLAQKANISRRTFYRCFRTKDDVMKYTSALLMDEFADTLLKNHAADLKGIAQSYFEFWENYIDILLLLKKQHLLAGFWRLTLIWCEENPRKPPEQMGILMEEIVYENGNS